MLPDVPRLLQPVRRPDKRRLRDAPVDTNAILHERHGVLAECDLLRHGPVHHAVPLDDGIRSADESEGEQAASAVRRLRVGRRLPTRCYCRHLGILSRHPGGPTVQAKLPSLPRRAELCGEPILLRHTAADALLEQRAVRIHHVQDHTDTAKHGDSDEESHQCPQEEILPLPADVPADGRAVVLRLALRLHEQARGDEDMPADMADPVASDARYPQETAAEARKQAAVRQEEAGDHRDHHVDIRLQ